MLLKVPETNSVSTILPVSSVFRSSTFLQENVQGLIFFYYNFATKDPIFVGAAGNFIKRNFDRAGQSENSLGQARKS